MKGVMKSREAIAIGTAINFLPTVLCFSVSFLPVKLPHRFSGLFMRACLAFSTGYLLSSLFNEMMPEFIEDLTAYGNRSAYLAIASLFLLLKFSTLLDKDQKYSAAISNIIHKSCEGVAAGKMLVETEEGVYSRVGVLMLNELVHTSGSWCLHKHKSFTSRQNLFAQMAANLSGYATFMMPIWVPLQQRDIYTMFSMVSFLYLLFGQSLPQLISQTSHETKIHRSGSGLVLVTILEVGLLLLGYATQCQ